MSVNPEAVGDMPEKADEYMQQTLDSDQEPDASEGPDRDGEPADARGAGDAGDPPAAG
jgi:hypothetical protein